MSNFETTIAKEFDVVCAEVPPPTFTGAMLVRSGRGRRRRKLLALTVGLAAAIGVAVPTSIYLRDQWVQDRAEQAAEAAQGTFECGDTPTGNRSTDGTVSLAIREVLKVSADEPPAIRIGISANASSAAPAGRPQLLRQDIPPRMLILDGGVVVGMTPPSAPGRAVAADGLSWPLIKGQEFPYAVSSSRIVLCDGLTWPKIWSTPGRYEAAVDMTPPVPPESAPSSRPPLSAHLVAVQPLP